MYTMMIIVKNISMMMVGMIVSTLLVVIAIILMKNTLRWMDGYTLEMIGIGLTIPT